MDDVDDVDEATPPERSTSTLATAPYSFPPLFVLPDEPLSDDDEGKPSAAMKEDAGPLLGDLFVTAAAAAPLTVARSTETDYKLETQVRQRSEPFNMQSDTGKENDKSTHVLTTGQQEQKGAISPSAKGCRAREKARGKDCRGGQSRKRLNPIRTFTTETGS